MIGCGDNHGVISIHAPRAGGDNERREAAETGGKISIHAPRAGGDK